MEDNLTQIQFIELRAAGKTYDAIAAQLGVCRKTLYNWSKKLDFRRQINALSEMEIEAIKDRHSLSEMAKREFLAKTIKTISEEISKRDFKNNSTAVLVRIMVQLEDRLDRDVREFDKKLVAEEENRMQDEAFRRGLANIRARSEYL